MTEMPERNPRNERPGRDRRGETLRLSWGADARTPAAEPLRPAAGARRGERRSARFGPERAAAERAFAGMKDREPGAPLELPGDRERATRFGAADRALREEWRRLRAAEGAERG
jgi:hypothetical protein